MCKKVKLTLEFVKFYLANYQCFILFLLAFLVKWLGEICTFYREFIGNVLGILWEFLEIGNCLFYLMGVTRYTRVGLTGFTANRLPSSDPLPNIPNARCNNLAIAMQR